MRLRMIHISFELDCRRGILARYDAYSFPSLLDPSLCVYKIRRYDAKLECIVRESIFVKDKTLPLQKPQCCFYLSGTKSQGEKVTFFIWQALHSGSLLQACFRTSLYRHTSSSALPSEGC